MATKQVLNIDELSGPTVAINGTEYPLVRRAFLSPLEARQFAQYGKELEALMASPELTDEQAAALGTITDRMCRVILEAPDGVHEILSDRNRVAIINAFFTAPDILDTPNA